MARHAVTRRRGSAVRGAIWMFIVSLLLCWLPLLGPLIAGYVGGRKAGGVGSAIAAVFLPAVVVAVLFFVLFTLTGFPLVGALSGGAAFLAVAAAMVGPLLVGAIIGGVMAD